MSTYNLRSRRSSAGPMNASIAEVDVVPTYKEVTEIDLTDTPNPKFKTKTIVGKTVPKSSKKKAVKKASEEVVTGDYYNLRPRPPPAPRPIAPVDDDFAYIISTYKAPPPQPLIQRPQQQEQKEQPYRNPYPYQQPNHQQAPYVAQPVLAQPVYNPYQQTGTQTCIHQNIVQHSKFEKTDLPTSELGTTC